MLQYLSFPFFLFISLPPHLPLPPPLHLAINAPLPWLTISHYFIRLPLPPPPFVLLYLFLPPRPVLLCLLAPPPVLLCLFLLVWTVLTHSAHKLGTRTIPMWLPTSVITWMEFRLCIWQFITFAKYLLN